MANARLGLCSLAITATLAFSIAVSALPRQASAADLVVKYDQSQIVRFQRDVAEIIIGNPTVAEVFVHNPKMLVVTGKTFGVTNAIFLDSKREVITEQRIIVVRDSTSVVSLHRGMKRETYNCTPQCNPSMTIGDDPNYFNTVKTLSESKMRYSEPNANAGGGGGGGNIQ